jgi:cell division protein FtsL
VITTIVGFSLAVLFFVLFLVALVVIFYQDWERGKLFKKAQFQQEVDSDDNNDPLAELIDEKEQELTEEKEEK